MPGKKSIFASEEDKYDENDMDAPMLDLEDEGEPGEGGVTATDVAQSKHKAEAESEPKCFIGLGNNPRLARDVLSQLGFKELSKGMQFSSNYRFRWTQTSSEINYHKFVEGEHIVNHISNARIFTNKISTLETLEQLKFALESGAIQSDIRLSDFFPETYRLDVVADLVNFLN